MLSPFGGRGLGGCNGSIGEGDGTPLQHSCLENPMDGGAWWAAVHGVTKSRRRLSNFIFTFHFHALEKEMATHSSVLAWRIPGTGEPGGLPSMESHIFFQEGLSRGSEYSSRRCTEGPCCLSIFIHNSLQGCICELQTPSHPSPAPTAPLATADLLCVPGGLFLFPP